MKDFSKKSQLKSYKISKGNLIKKIDATCSKAVLRMDNNISWDQPPCEGFMCCNHLFRRGLQKVRFYPLNMYCGSSGANFRHERFPEYMTTWFIRKYGFHVYEEMQALSIGEAKYTRQELDDILEFWNLVLLTSSKFSRETLAGLYMQKIRPAEHEGLKTALLKRLEGE